MISRDIVDYVKDCKKILVICSRPLDADSLASGLIIKKYFESLGKQVKAIFPHPFTAQEKDNYSYLPYFNELVDIDSREILQKGEFDCLVLVDGTNIQQFYDSSESAANPPDFSIISKRIHIDHHLQNLEKLGTLTIKRQDISSTTELILTEVIPENFINEEVATLAYAGIAGDCGNFKWNFYPSTLRLCAKLIEKGAKPEVIIDHDFFSKDEKYLKMLAFCIEHMEYNSKLHTSFLFLPYNETKKYSIDNDTYNTLKNIFDIDLARSVKGFPLSFILIEKKPGIISLSSRGNFLHNKINLPKMLEEIGGNGGGHFNAAGQQLEGNFEEIKKSLLKSLKKHHT